MRTSLLAMLALAALAAPGLARSPKPALNVQPAGKAVNCIQPSRIRETRVRDDQTIDFYMTGNQVYRNVLPLACPSLGSERRFGYETSIDELCSVDTIHVLYSSPGVPGPICGLGQFQPITGAPY